MKPWRLLPFSTAVALSTLLPARASAHLVNTDVGEFYAGMLHPLTSAEHQLPILALALLASQCGKVSSVRKPSALREAGTARTSRGTMNRSRSFVQRAIPV